MTQTEAGPNDRIFVIPPATYTLETFKAALQTALRVDYPDWTVGDTITTPGARVIIPSLGEITNPAWYNVQWRGVEYNPLDSRALNGFFSGTSVHGVWTGTISLPKRGVLVNICVLLQPGRYDGPGFAAELQTALRAGVTQATGAEATSITVAQYLTGQPVRHVSVASVAHLQC